eukprot:1975403-Amphidinium_carterae.1
MQELVDILESLCIKLRYRDDYLEETLAVIMLTLKRRDSSGVGTAYVECIVLVSPDVYQQ